MINFAKNRNIYDLLICKGTARLNDVCVFLTKLIYMYCILHHKAKRSKICSREQDFSDICPYPG